MTRPVVYWFRHDLRLTDLPGLAAAAQHGPVIPVFILDDGLGDDWQLGGASRWWLHHSLVSLSRGLQDLGGQLLLRRGKTVDTLVDVVREVGAQAVLCSRQYQPWSAALERDVRAAVTELDGDFKRYPGTLLFEPGAITTGSGTPYKVFTPFWRACQKAPAPAHPIPCPRLTFPSQWPVSDNLDDWELRPTQPDWAEGWEALWQPGETGAQQALSGFLADNVEYYAEARDFPGAANTSRLSPYLKFGEISPRQIWWAAHNLRTQTPTLEQPIDKFLSEIGWREFCNHLLALFPEMPDRSFNPKFAHFPWQADPSHVRAWQQGETGYPIVDAGMRELWQTGFMHNRIRMVVASFLTKHLLSHWRVGEAWFWDCLLDADLASNACSWQWVAGSGADAAPYFRVFNPVAQGEKFDKDGSYTRRWVPELAALPDKYLHKPWEAPAMTLSAAGVSLGDNYPLPLVDHKEARTTALEAYATLKSLG